MSGGHRPLAAGAIVQAVLYVLGRERSRSAVSVTFLGRTRMVRLHARWKGRVTPTDVLAFSLTLPNGDLLGDIYVCRWRAVQEARLRRVPLREELLRLVIHGTLHLLGYDHPVDHRRTRSLMWRKQERYLRCLG